MIEKLLNRDITLQPASPEYIYVKFYHYDNMSVHFFIISHLKISTWFLCVFLP